MVQRLAFAGVASEFSSLPEFPVGVTVQDAVTHVLGQHPGYVDDMASGKPALFKRDCTERFYGTLAFDARLRGNPRLYGSVLGRLVCQGFDHGWHR